MELSQFSLEGKVALVSGGSRGIGEATAVTLAKAGADVAVVSRKLPELERVAAEIRKLGRRAIALEAHLGRVEQLGPLVERVTAELGSLDILVNNASSFYPTPPGEITVDQWDDLIGSNLKAPLFLAQAAISELKKSRGAIINIVDIHAQRPLRNHAVYGAAKAGLAMLTRSLAKDLAPDIRVNGVSPGAILWPEDNMSEATRKSILAQIPLNRSGTPDDIAGCVLYLARDASYVTGQIIAVDGGRSTGW